MSKKKGPFVVVKRQHERHYIVGPVEIHGFWLSKHTAKLEAEKYNETYWAGYDYAKRTP